MKNLVSVPIRVLVTGTRGKSALVRLLQAGVSSLGIPAWGRITGVLPREIGPLGERLIERSGGGHVEEMRWWLRQVPPGAGAVIMENGAVSPELQGLAARWLQPGVVVWTNAWADHLESWGPGQRGAETVLLQGIPRFSKVAAGFEVARSPLVRAELEKKDCRLEFPPEASPCHYEFGAENLALAKLALRLLGLDAVKAGHAMESLSPDLADFSVIRESGGVLAQAFSANDVQSAARIWGSLGWESRETVFLYNHRPDRPARLESFMAWAKGLPWKEACLTGPFASGLFGSHSLERVHITTTGDLRRFIGDKKRVFGCGNVAGVPIRYLEERRAGKHAA